MQLVQDSLGSMLSPFLSPATRRDSFSGKETLSKRLLYDPWPRKLSIVAISDDLTYCNQFRGIAFFATVRRTILTMIMSPLPPNDDKILCGFFRGAGGRRDSRVSYVSMGTIVHSSALFFDSTKDHWRVPPEFGTPEPWDFAALPST